MRWMSTTPDVDDFDDYAYDESDGTEVDYIFFTDLPSSSKGTLYYDYGYSSEREVEEEEEFDEGEEEAEPAPAAADEMDFLNW